MARNFAHKVGYELDLKPRAAIQYLNLQDDPLATARVSNDECSAACVEDYWKNIFVRYHKHIAPELFKSHNLLDEGDSEQGYDFSIFSIRDWLINAMINRDIEDHGAGVYVRSLVDFFPIHTMPHLDDIMSDMKSLNGATQLPLASFLYYAIAIYIKSTWRHAQLPDIDDEEFNKQTIRPLKEWLLANKIFDTVGLSFDDFDRTFSSCIWLRKYYPQTADEIQINVVGQRNSGKFDVCLGGNNPSGADNPHLMRTYRKGHLGSDAHGRTEAAAKREMSIGADTMQNIGYQMSTIGQQTIKSQADKLTKKVARNKWAPEATEWLPKLRLVADNASAAPKVTREKLFDRLDNTDRQLMSHFLRNKEKSNKNNCSNSNRTVS